MGTSFLKFGICFDVILGGFRVYKEKQVLEKCKQLVPKTEMWAGNKVVRETHPGGEKCGGGALITFKDTPVHPHHREQSDTL